MEESGKKYCKVCVTGAAGYVGSSLIKKLLQRGTYIVHATLRNLGESTKVGVLKSLPGAETRLRLFEADIYNPDQFEAAIRDCEFVLHVATPLQHTHNSQYKDTTEAAVAGVKSILMSCIRSGTVRRLIYTASVVAASPLKHDGSGFSDSMDENCWTPPHLPIPFMVDYEQDYMISKMQSEKEVLKYGEGGNLEVVTLGFGLIGGDTTLPYPPRSMMLFLTPITEDEAKYNQLRFLEELLGKVPIIHIDDVSEAHIFCLEKDSINGRFLCASDYVSSAEIAQYYKQNYPEFCIKEQYLEGPKRSIQWGAKKLIDKGFKYNCDMKFILDDCLDRKSVV